MRHRIQAQTFGRKSEHRKAMFMNLIVSLIEHGRIKTTLAKAKAARPLAEKLVTIAKSGTLHDRRVALSRLGNKRAVVTKLFTEVATTQRERVGGYTRIVKLGARNSDAAEMAFLEFVEPAGSASKGEVDELKALEKKLAKAEKEKKKE
ncbi:MAG: 50S ribosomal protein L17 [Verrucomicrobiae bacterium]|nr:50S ribosomal protein L17 [Verrucomicrobiae bacterium]